VRSLDPALRLARIGANYVNVECVERPTKLGHAVAAERTIMVAPEDAVLVAVKCDRLAPGFKVGAGCLEIGESRLAFDKLKVHQPARRIVDKDQ